MRKPHYLLRYRHVISIIVFMIFAGLLISCDPPSHRYFSVNQIVIVNKIPYAHASELTSYGIGADVKKGDYYFFSQDYGKTWDEVPSSLTQIPSLFEKIDNEQYHQLPLDVRKLICVPGDTDVCYRILGKEKVEISTDGGETWHTDWKMPSGRKAYMSRNPKITKFLRVEPDTIPYDLGIISEAEGHFVIVAMGNQGVLVKSPDGVWNRYAASTRPVSIRLASPLPYYARNMNEAIESVRKEMNLSLLATLFFFFSTSVIKWRRIRSEISKSEQKKFVWVNIPFVIFTGGSIVITLFLVVILTLILFRGDVSIDLPIGFSKFSEQMSLDLICIMPYIGLLISWLVYTILFVRKENAVIFSLAFFKHLIFFTGVMLPFILWAFGVIPYYEIALPLAIVSGLMIFIWAISDDRKTNAPNLSDET